MGGRRADGAAARISVPTLKATQNANVHEILIFMLSGPGVAQFIPSTVYSPLGTLGGPWGPLGTLRDPWGSVRTVWLLYEALVVPRRAQACLAVQLQIFE